MMSLSSYLSILQHGIVEQTCSTDNSAKDVVLGEVV